MVNFLEFLSDVVLNFDHFSNDINSIFLSPVNNSIIATGNHPRRQLYYRISSKMDDEILSESVLGSIGYLKSILSMSVMKENPSYEIEYRKNKDNPNKLYGIDIITFKAKRIEIKYRCTNPAMIDEKDRIKSFKRPNDAIFFSVDKILKKEFDEVSRLSKNDDKKMMLTYDGNYIRSVFGSQSHISSFILSDNITGNMENFEKGVDLEKFKTMLKLAADNSNGKVGISDNSVWVDFTTTYGSEHNIVIPIARKNEKG